MARFTENYHCHRSSARITVKIGPYVTTQETNTGYMRMSEDVIELLGPPERKIIRNTQVGAKSWSYKINADHMMRMEDGWLDG